MICLGIEGSAHTIAVAIVSSKGTVLSDVREMYKTVERGIIPIEAAKHHRNVKEDVIKKALEESKEKKIDLVINIPKSYEEEELTNDYLIRRKAVDFNIPLLTNAQIAKLFVESISSKKMEDLEIKSWDEYS